MSDTISLIPRCYHFAVSPPRADWHLYLHAELIIIMPIFSFHARLSEWSIIPVVNFYGHFDAKMLAMPYGYSHRSRQASYAMLLKGKLPPLAEHTTELTLLAAGAGKYWLGCRRPIALPSLYHFIMMLVHYILTTECHSRGRQHDIVARISLASPAPTYTPHRGKATWYDDRRSSRYSISFYAVHLYHLCTVISTISDIIIWQ